ncbi:MAG: hypothetical protein GWN00_09570 [Aliifodinibius sp.]|nr:hypothetical protein [Fodinibius sp.]NIV11435.1 hypothetical protein [Fodinibius sp.]NIY25040.1 hypothetical protein [Fodinibius sp.]
MNGETVSGTILSNPAISNNITGVFCTWLEENPQQGEPPLTFFRRKPKAIFDDISENSLWTGNVWIGDTQPPREEITIPAGVTVTLDDDATLYLQGNWIHVYGEFYFDPANVVFDGGEIFIHNNGIAYNNGTGSGSIYGEGSCITVKLGGRYITSNPEYQLSFADGALLLNDGGSIELSDNSKLTVKTYNVQYLCGHFQY